MMSPDDMPVPATDDPVVIDTDPEDPRWDEPLVIAIVPTLPRDNDIDTPDKPPVNDTNALDGDEEDDDPDDDDDDSDPDPDPDPELTHTDPPECAPAP